MKVKVNPVTLETSDEAAKKLQIAVSKLGEVRAKYLSELKELRGEYEPKIDSLLAQIQKLSKKAPE